MMYMIEEALASASSANLESFFKSIVMVIIEPSAAYSTISESSFVEYSVPSTPFTQM